MSGGHDTLAVFGGSFDPPHLGHVLVPTWVLSRGLASRVLVAPCYTHVFDKALSAFDRRLALTHAAMSVHPRAVWVSDVERRLALESRRERPSYALELCERVAQDFPAARVRLVIGSDIVQSGETARWHEWDEVCARFDPIVVPRSGYSEDPGALPPIASTAVRELLAAPANEARDASLSRMVPERVLRALTEAPLELAVVGRGHAGLALGRWLQGRGVRVRLVEGRALDPRAMEGVDGVLLAVRDPAIPEVATRLAGKLAPAVPVLCAAGSRAAATNLAALAEAGHPVGTLHPICSLRSEAVHDELDRCAFGVEGDAPAVNLAERLIGRAPRLRLDHLDEDARIAYHAACALVANHLAVPWAAATDVLRGLGLPERESSAALGVLLRSALENLLELGVPGGITGPAVRGDMATLTKHAAALKGPTGELYTALSSRLVALLELESRA